MEETPEGIPERTLLESILKRTSETIPTDKIRARMPGGTLERIPGVISEENCGENPDSFLEVVHDVIACPPGKK